MSSTAIAALIALLSVPYISALQVPGVVQVPVARGSHHTVQKRANSKLASVDLMNLDAAYTINISIAGQSTSVVLDTGSFELWVDPDCSTASRINSTGSEDESDTTDEVDSPVSSPQYCETISRYDPSSSSSAEPLGSGAVFRYADTTTIEINYYTDTIDIGGLTLTKQQFGVANITNATGLGIMGMGPSPLAGYNLSSQPYSLILDSMVSQGQIASRAFSLDLRDYDNSTGSLIFGGLDKKKFSGSLQTLPLESVQMTSQAADGQKVTFTDYGYYVNVQSVGITKPPNDSSQFTGVNSFLAVLDSGTSVILTPKGLSSQICGYVDGTELDEDGASICVVDCSVRDQAGGLDINFDGKTIQVTYENLVLQAGTTCYLGTSDTTVETDPPTYILGAPFLRAAYAVFDWDNQQVHLAEAADCGSDVVAIGSGTKAVPTDGGCKESSSLPSVGRSMTAVFCAAFVSMAFLA